MTPMSEETDTARVIQADRDAANRYYGYDDEKDLAYWGHASAHRDVERLAQAFARHRIAQAAPAGDGQVVYNHPRECQSIWRCAIGDVVCALDVLKNQWIGSRRKTDREAGAKLSGVLDFVWDARSPAPGSYLEASKLGTPLIKRVRAALDTSAATEDVRHD